MSRTGGRDRGLALVLVALCMVVLMAGAALAIDISRQVNERQDLHNTLDTAAHAGAFALPDAVKAEAEALKFAKANDPDSSPIVDFFCITGTAPGPVVDEAYIPAACDPGPGPYAGVACDDRICAIPCVPAQGDSCNAIRVRDEAEVEYAFAPAIGSERGSTGSLHSVACRGGCGTLPVQPIDFVVVGDRTSSMGGEIAPLEDAILNVLEHVSPALHRIAIGTIGRTSPTAPPECPSAPSGSSSSGPFVPAPLADDYDLTDVNPPSSPPDLNDASVVVRSAQCIGDANSSTGTDLPGALAAAINELQTNGRPDALPAIIFMTDGVPNVAGKTVDEACTTTEDLARMAKDAGILIVTIAFRLEGDRCNGSKSALQFLANVASPRSSGTPSADDGGGTAGSGCDTSTKVDGENADGDYFFCTPDPDDLEEIFESAVDSVQGGIRLIRLPST